MSCVCSPWKNHKNVDVNNSKSVDNSADPLTILSVLTCLHLNLCFKLESLSNDVSVLYKPSVFTVNPFYASPSQMPQ